MKLYPKKAEDLGVSTRWWSEHDYRAVLAAMEKTGAKRCLEFGPGSSTLALIEGGASSVDTCEDAPDWAEVYEERLVKRFPTAEWPCELRLHRFEWPEGKKLSIPSLGKQRFDLTLIDGPLGTERRPDVVRFALARSTWVLAPTEEFKTRAFLRPLFTEIAEKAGRSIEVTETGPLSGAFALIGPPGSKPLDSTGSRW